MTGHMHTGRRSRVRQRFLEEGLEHFQPHEVLEILLFYARAQGDTNAMGHALLREFGSFSRVFDAPYERLLEMPGVGEQTAVLLKLIPSLAKKYMEDRDKTGVIVTSVQDIWEQFRYVFLNAVNEQVYALFLDNKNMVIKRELLMEGSVNMSSVPKRRLMEIALSTHASGVVLCHNHPNGVVIPSKADVETTKGLLMLLELQGIRFVDHMIVARDEYCSLRESGLISNWR